MIKYPFSQAYWKSNFKLSNLSAADFKVISDLKFLVERLKIWYERNGGKIVLSNNF